ncbi:MAG: acetolactate synthase-1/2/3 large subunit [Rhodothermales bacterium]|jgi:acetolactate synthase-1/2/3 large subunit
MTGSDFIVRCFRAHNIDCLFTYPGGTIAPTYDECVKQSVRLYVSIHEQGAGYAALARARLSGQTQVVAVTSGPGATNLVTPIADAFFDSTPVVVITGQVGTGDLRSGRPVRQTGFQQVDTAALYRPITKAVLQPMTPDDLLTMLPEAFALAREGRPGPVLIDLPMDVQRGNLTTEPGSLTRDLAPPPPPDSNAILGAATLLANAERPVILAGQGVLLANAHEELRALARSRRIPVVMSILGLGAVPTNSPEALGYLGHTGNQYAGLAVQNADVLLVVGARLDVRQTGSRVDTWVPDGQVVRIDLDPTELDHPRVRVDHSIRADAREALAMLNGALASHGAKDLSVWHEQILEWRREFPLEEHPAEADALPPQPILKAANRLTRGRDAVIVSGVGSHQQWTARHLDFDFPRRPWLTSGGHGAMGYDLPTAIGAQLARPDSLVLCFVGDGSLQMNIQELQAVAAHNLPIKLIVLDNHRLGIVSQFQQLNWNSDPTTGGKKNPDLAAVARAYGIPAFTVRQRSEVDAALEEAISMDGPALVHCLIDSRADVVPMLMGGQRLDQMWPYHPA